MAKRALKVGKMQCPECLAIVPSEARACRHCGHRFSEAQLEQQKSHEARINKFKPLAAIVLIGGVLSISTCVYNAATRVPTAEETARTAEFWAKGTAAAAVKQRMKNPASFELVDASAIPTTEKDGSQGWAVGVTYRGTNSFGGVITENALVAVDETGRIPLEVTDLKPKPRHRR